MIRNFMAGVAWGTVVAGLGLAIISEVAPLPGGGGDAPLQTPMAVIVPSDTLAAVQPEPAVPVATVTAPVVAAQTEAPVQGDPAAVMPAATGTGPTDLTGVAPVVIEALPQPAPVPDVAPVAEAAPQPEAESPPQVLADAPEAAAMATGSVTSPQVTADMAPVGSVVPPALDVSPSASDAPPAVVQLPLPPVPEVKEVLLQPGPAPEAPPGPAEVTPAPMPQIGAATVQDPAALPQVEIAPEAQPVPETAKIEPVVPEMAEVTEPAVIAPDTGLPSATSEGRLPHIGQADAPAVDQVPDVSEDLTRLKRYARSYIAQGDKPRFAVVLIDDGSKDLDRAKLAALPFAVTFAVDPLAANATEAEQIYRAAGQEVLILAKGIPEGATPGDLEQSLQAISAALPESVGLLDLDSGGFQDNRALSAQVVSILKAQGRGMLTYDRGLNAADQEARREDLPAAKVFRLIDGGSEEAPVIRRYLDRAAFKAAQEGQVVVVGHTRPETITALLEWTVEGRAASVSMAPASAVMQTK